MTTRRRLAVVLAAFAGVTGLAVPLASAAQAPAPVTVPTKSWSCLGVRALNIGICLSDPLAEQ